MPRLAKIQQVVGGDKNIAELISAIYSMAPDSTDTTFIKIVRENGAALVTLFSNFLDMLIGMEALLTNRRIYCEKLADYSEMLSSELLLLNSEDDLEYKKAYSKFKSGSICRDALNIAAKIKKSGLTLDMPYLEFAKKCSTGTTSVFIFVDCGTNIVESPKSKEARSKSEVVCNNLAHLFDGGVIAAKLSETDRTKAFTYIRGMLNYGKQILSQLQIADVDMDALFSSVISMVENNPAFNRHKRAIAILKKHSEKFKANYKKYMKGAITGSTNPASIVMEYVRDILDDKKAETADEPSTSSRSEIVELRKFLAAASKMFNTKHLSPQQAAQLRQTTTSLTKFLDEFSEFSDFDDITKTRKFDLNAELAKLNEVIASTGSCFGAEANEEPKTGSS